MDAREAAAPELKHGAVRRAHDGVHREVLAPVLDALALGRDGEAPAQRVLHGLEDDVLAGLHDAARHRSGTVPTPAILKKVYPYIRTIRATKANRYIL